jgi:hypothetical protein
VCVSAAGGVAVDLDWIGLDWVGAVRSAGDMDCLLARLLGQEMEEVEGRREPGMTAWMPQHSTAQRITAHYTDQHIVVVVDWVESGYRPAQSSQRYAATG